MLLHRATIGDGPRRIFLVHGLSGDGATFAELAARIAADGATVTAVDLRGHGRSPRADAYTLDDFSADLVETLPVGLDAILAHSLGGAALLRAVDRLRPAHAVYLDPALRLRVPTAGGLGRLVLGAPGAFPLALGLGALGMRRPVRTPTSLPLDAAARRHWDRRMMLPAFRALATAPWPAAPDALAIPSTVLLSADARFVLPPALQRDLAAAGWDIRHAPGLGHGLWLQDPAAVHALLRDRLRGEAAPARSDAPGFRGSPRHASPLRCARTEEAMSPTPLRATARSIVALAIGTLLAVAAPLAASAHVTLTTNTAAPGSYALLTFQVPNESATAVTKKLTVTLPSGTPLASVSFVPVPGWNTQLVTTTLPAPVGSLTKAVTSVVYTARGAGIADGQLQLFMLSVGPIPDVGQLALPVEQGYSDGTVVAWKDPVGGAHPAPVLYVTDTPPVAGAGTPSPVPEVSATDATGQPDVVARVLGILGVVGLGVGIVGIALAVSARRRLAAMTAPATGPAPAPSEPDGAADAPAAPEPDAPAEPDAPPASTDPRDPPRS